MSCFVFVLRLVVSILIELLCEVILLVVWCSCVLLCEIRMIDVFFCSRDFVIVCLIFLDLLVIRVVLFESLRFIVCFDVILDFEEDVVVC